MKSVRGIPCHGTCWYFNRIAQNMRHPSPQRSNEAFVRAEGISRKWENSIRGDELKLNEKYFPFTQHTTHRRSTWHLNFGQRSVHWISKCWWQLWSPCLLPPILVPRGESSLLCLVWVAFHFPKKEIKHFHSSCFCFALIKVDRKTIIEMIQTRVCVCVCEAPA